MAWVERASPSFTARFEERDADDAARVVEQLEQARGDFSGRFPRPTGQLTVLIHDSQLALALAAPYLAGQVAHLRPAIARRLHEGPRPAFPPGVRDAALLGGTVFDLLAREEGQRAATTLAVLPLHPGGREAALVKAFGGREISQTATTWRAHLERLASAS